MKQQQHIHILGICGTFMAGVAILAREKGFKVTGCDANVYPPMSTQLHEYGIQLIQGYESHQLDELKADLYIIGNAMSRGKFPLVEEILNRKLPYTSGPQWVAENILNQYENVIAISGTHGKTTTTSMISWICAYAGLNPGFLVGGVPENFGVSSKLGSGKIFVIEADEYDSAFFDKRSKFIHYHPHVLILNNLEFDHADIFPDLNAIQTQFHYLVRTVPAAGLIIKNHSDKNLEAVLERGCWTPIQTFGENKSLQPDWSIGETNIAGSEFEIKYQNNVQGKITWPLIGKHNQYNALASIAAAYRCGVEIQTAIQALNSFKNVKRRLELLREIRNMKIYSDFAHHPTAIHTTLSGLRAQVGNEKIMVILECGSNTMRMGVHRDTLAKSLEKANHIIFLRPLQDWGIQNVKEQCHPSAEICENIDEIIVRIKAALASENDNEKLHVILMSNSSFQGLPQKILSEIF